MSKKTIRAFVLVFSILVFVVIFNFTTNLFQPRAVANIIETCQTICKGELSKNIDLSNGPCLLNPIPNYEDWVCDVSHWPREAVDGNETNQCSEYTKTADHFVEVFPNCSFIRAV